MKDAAGPDEGRSWGPEGYSVAGVTRSGRCVDIQIKGSGFSFPQENTLDAERLFIVLAMFGHHLYKAPHEL